MKCGWYGVPEVLEVGQGKAHHYTARQALKPTRAEDDSWELAALWSEPVGIVEIAERLNVRRATVDKWIVRRILPEHRCLVGGRPCWNWRTIEVWAEETGRLPEYELEEAF